MRLGKIRLNMLALYSKANQLLCSRNGCMLLASSQQHPSYPELIWQTIISAVLGRPPVISRADNDAKFSSPDHDTSADSARFLDVISSVRSQPSPSVNKHPGDEGKGGIQQLGEGAPYREGGRGERRYRPGDKSPTAWEGILETNNNTL